ncbi:MAG: hypothetical protein H0V49_10855 [Nocardioidaceae bacterium]|nr:hypothetical protein [Nocardioidaceae bacterium]
MTANGIVSGLRALPRRTVTGALDLVQHPQLLLDRIEATLSEIAALTLEVYRVTAAANAGVAAVAEVCAEVERTTAQAAVQVRRVEQLLDSYTEPLEAVAPLVAETATAISPDHVRLVGRLLDLVPDEAERVERAVGNLVARAPDLEELGERLNSVGEVVEGIPGAGLLRRRGQAAEESG